MNDVDARPQTIIASWRKEENKELNEQIEAMIDKNAVL